MAFLFHLVWVKFLKENVILDKNVIFDSTGFAVKDVTLKYWMMSHPSFPIRIEGRAGMVVLNAGKSSGAFS